MKQVLFVMLLALALPALEAQTRSDTSGEAEAEQLRQQIRQRWNARVRQELNLSDDQAAKLQGTEQKFTQQRVELAQRQRTVNEALRGQLQPASPRTRTACGGSWTRGTATGPPWRRSNATRTAKSRATSRRCSRRATR